MLPVNTPDYQKPRFINRQRRNLDQIGIIPERLRIDEIHTVLFTVRTALALVKLERRHGIENIPLLSLAQPAVGPKLVASNNAARANRAIQGTTALTGVGTDTLIAAESCHAPILRCGSPVGARRWCQAT